MRQISLALFSIFILFSSDVIANDDCLVIGFHQPGTHIYDGPTWCESVHFKNITVRGPLQVDQSAISGLIDVSGPVSVFHTMLDEITIENTGSHQKICINNNSAINRNIVFLGPAGTVLLSKDSVLKGKVINGSIKN